MRGLPVLRVIAPAVALLCTFTVAAAASADDHTVQVVNNAFIPADLTIEVGDTVTWVNSGIDHNVRTTSGPESFRCANGCDGEPGGNGAPASNPWSFSRTFDNEGTVRYECEVHAAVGMTGRIVVEAGAGNGGDDEPLQPGSVAFSQSLYQVTEAAGTATLGVQRSGGDDGSVSVRVRNTGGTATPDVDFVPVNRVLGWADGEGGVRSFDVTILDDDEVEGVETVTFSLSQATGGLSIAQPATATLEIIDDDLDIPPCTPDATTLCLGAGDRFQVQVTWRDSADRTGEGSAVDIAKEDSGLFYFFDPDNIELLVKVLDACVEPLGNKFWVLFAASTDVELTLTVTDTEANIVKTYRNELGNLAQATIDVEAFDTCP